MDINEISREGIDRLFSEVSYSVSRIAMAEGLTEEDVWRYVVSMATSELES